MKIAILVHKLTGGGAERVAALWAKGFAQRGNEVLMILSDDKSPITYEVPNEVRIAYLTSHQSFKILRVLQRMRNRRRILRREKPDVVIGIMAGTECYLSAFGMGIHFINTDHNSYERPRSAPMPMRVWIRKFRINRLFDQVTVLTEADKKVIGKRIKNTIVLPNPLATPPVKVMPKKQQMVLAVGRLDAWHCKGFDVLIKAWSRIARGVSPWRLQIVGNGDKGKAYLKRLCLEYNVLDSVVFLDFQEDIQPIYQSASIFVLSSRYEGFGLVLIEAMSQGCACIACDYKGRQREIIRNEDEGLICEPENITQLSDAIKLLINDRDKRGSMARNAIERSKDFSLDNIMKKWDEIL